MIPQISCTEINPIPSKTVQTLKRNYDVTRWDTHDSKDIVYARFLNMLDIGVVGQCRSLLIIHYQ